MLHWSLVKFHVRFPFHSHIVLNLRPQLNCHPHLTSINYLRVYYWELYSLQFSRFYPISMDNTSLNYLRVYIKNYLKVSTAVIVATLPLCLTHITPTRGIYIYVWLLALLGSLLFINLMMQTHLCNLYGINFHAT